MRKKIAVFLAAGMLLTAVPTATSCAKAPEEAPTESQTETTAATTTTQTEETITETETQKEYSSDIDSQMDIIVKSYDFIWSDYFVYSEAYPGTSFAVTDLNHNGRLEVIVSSIQGSGAFSLTNFYEISEDYSTLERLKVNGEDEPDAAGDFLMSKDSADHVALYACYMKDGEYYYLLEDIISGGWDYKVIMYYAYSFGNGVTRDFIGGCEVSAEYTDDIITVNTWLHGPSNTLFGSDEEYLEHLFTFWDDYAKQDSCEIQWMEFNNDTNFPAAASESYYGFNPHSAAKATITYDYHYFFDRIYGAGGDDAYEYVIRDSNEEQETEE